LPEVDALFVSPRSATRREEIDVGTRVSLALDYAAAKAFTLTVRYAVLAGDLGAAESSAIKPKRHGLEVRNVRLAERVSRRLRAPVECRDAARLAARWLRAVHRVRELRPAALLDLLTAADALRRPERLDALLAACESDAMSLPHAGDDYAAARIVRSALAVVKGVDAGAIADAVTKRRKPGAAEPADAPGKAVRAARLAALRVWRRTALPPMR
jgi:tRNA nucleotidyltransferase (CCA-adding enzyme)